MTILLKILIIIFLTPLISVAQSSSTLIGARSNALAYASGCIDDDWSLFNNVAGIAEVENVSDLCHMSTSSGGLMYEKANVFNLNR